MSIYIGVPRVREATIQGAPWTLNTNRVNIRPGKGYGIMYGCFRGTIIWVGPPPTKSDHKR